MVLRVREIQTLLIQGYRADFAKHSGKTNAALFDVGLPVCMADIPIQTVLSQDFGSYKGFIAENYVARELQSSGFTELYSWKGKTSEIEFLVVINGKIIPLEVKSGSRMNRAKSLAAYREKYNPESTVIVSARPERISGNRHNLPLYKVSAISIPMESRPQMR